MVFVGIRVIKAEKWWLCVRLDQSVMFLTKLIIVFSKIRIIDQQTKKLLIVINILNHCCPVNIQNNKIIFCKY